MDKQVYIDRAKAQREELRQWIRKVKESSPCTDCGVYYRYYVMEFDHMPDHSKVDIINNLVNRGNRPMIEDELKKCELVCANCHRERTHQRALA